MEGPGLINGGQNLRLLCRCWFSARDADRPEQDSRFGDLRFQVVAFLQMRCLPNILRQRELRRTAKADESHGRVSGVQVGPWRFV